RDKPIAPASPWQNGFVERLIGSIRRECADHIIVLDEAHLRQVLKSYARYYNEARTHLALDKDAPVSRAVQRTGVRSEGVRPRADVAVYYSRHPAQRCDRGRTSHAPPAERRPAPLGVGVP